MKKAIQFGLILFLVNVSFSQSIEQKNNISIGGGKGAYKGDLGNSWFQPDEEWYGYFALHYNRYINKSFDFGSSLTFGDYGRCREEGDLRYRPDGTEILNMLSRLTSLVVCGKYKFANGYLMKENSKFEPYIYAGAGINNISEYWWEDKKRAIEGNYASLNGGFGVRYNFAKRFNFTYNLGLGYFSSDKIDDRVQGDNDMFMQQSILLGMNF